MDRIIERSISASLNPTQIMVRIAQTRINDTLNSIREAHEELQQPAFWSLERVVVRKNLIKLIQQCTFLMAELDEDQVEQEKLPKRELEGEEKKHETTLIEQARGRLEKTTTQITDQNYNPILAVLLLVVFHVGFFLLVGAVVCLTNAIWYCFTPR